MSECERMCLRLVSLGRCAIFVGEMCLLCRLPMTTPELPLSEHHPWNLGSHMKQQEHKASKDILPWYNS